LTFICFVHFGSSTSNVYTASWAPTTNHMSSIREQCAVIMLNNGNVLVCGGGTNGQNSSAVDTCDIYNVSTNTFTLAGHMNSQRGGPAYSILQDGRVYLAGGGNDSFNAMSSAEIFDPKDNSFTVRSDLPYSMYCPTTVLLPSGLLLICGGVDNDFGEILTALLYNVSSDTYSAAGEISRRKFMGPFVWLNDGTVAVIGYNIDIYNPSNNSWTQPDIQPPFLEQGIIAFTLSDGTVAITAGWNGEESISNVTIWDPVTGNYTDGGNLNVETSFSAAMLLPDDAIVVAGGIPNITGYTAFATNAADIWQLGTLKSQEIAPMQFNRGYTNGIAIGTYKMLVVGGTDENQISVSTAEVVTITPPSTTGVQLTSTSTTSSKGTSSTSSKGTSSTSGSSTSSSSTKGTSGTTTATSSERSYASNLQICATLVFAMLIFLI